MPIKREVTADSYNLRNLRSKYMAEERDKSCPRRPAKQYLRDEMPEKVSVKEKKQWKYNLDVTSPPTPNQSNYRNYVNRSMDKSS